MTIMLNPEPPGLMLGLNQQTVAQLVAGKIYQGLLAFDFDFTPRPSLAREWSVSEDGLVYRFTLFDAVFWHDGEPFTAEDVVFSTQIFLKETHPRARANFSHVREAVILDPLTVEYRLSAPFPPFLLAFEASSAPMIPKHIYAGTDFRNNPANQTPIGTGPFKFREWKRGQFIHLVKNERYFRKGLPHLSEIYFQIIPDSSSRLLALETGEADLASFSDIDCAFMPQVTANPLFDVTYKGYELAGPLAWMEFNHRVSPMGDKRFRQAVMHALDRDYIAHAIWFDQAAPATGAFNSSTRFYEPDTKRYPLDLEKATALLDEMGLKPDEKGVRANLKLLGLPHGEAWTRLSEYIKQALGKIGIAVWLESTDMGNWARRYAHWEFEMTLVFLYQYGDPALGVSRNYISSNIIKGAYGTNASGYINPTVDALFAKAAVENDETARAKLYSDVQKLLAEDVPNAWLIEIKFPTVVNRRFENVVTSATGVADCFDVVAEK
ncbi:peptide ABC transporter substrate-binding protein [Alphaproteobacteria bacterium]|nr:peptide ABC transporter substrate-binding protein [Alphaproteobacteria bacterium]